MLEGQSAIVSFPHPDEANEDGIVALGGDLAVDTLLSAYTQGIFPWFDDGQPILWWSPNPRFVMFPDKAVFPSRLSRSIRAKGFTFRTDTCFEQVIRGCAHSPRPGQKGTWITSDMIEAYCVFHEAGWAHSIEVFVDETLVGGLYGVQIGGAFFGESMFYLVPDASKAALMALNTLATKNNWHFIDSQVYTDNIKRFGGTEIHRGDYLELLTAAITIPSVKGKWQNGIPAFMGGEKAYG